MGYTSLHTKLTNQHIGTEHGAHASKLAGSGKLGHNYLDRLQVPPYNDYRYYPLVNHLASRLPSFFGTRKAGSLGRESHDNYVIVLCKLMNVCGHNFDADGESKTPTVDRPDNVCITSEDTPAGKYSSDWRQ